MTLTDPKTNTQSPRHQMADPRHRAPQVSVIMATYNGSASFGKASTAFWDRRYKISSSLSPTIVPVTKPT
jgi:hypothetical protein